MVLSDSTEARAEMRHDLSGGVRTLRPTTAGARKERPGRGWLGELKFIRGGALAYWEVSFGTVLTRCR